MNWHWIVLIWGVPLGIWLVVRAYGRRRPGATVRRETAALQSGTQIPRLGIGPGVLSKPEHSDRGTASKGDRPGMSWHCAFKLFIGRRMGALVSREAPMLQLNQEVPRRGRRQLSEGVAREWFYDRSRNREMDLRASGARQAGARPVTETGTS
jgi:hypothetical protein